MGVFYCKIRCNGAASIGRMRIFVVLQIVLFAFLSCLDLSGQTKEPVVVSPQVIGGIHSIECEKLDLGIASISTPPKYPAEAIAKRIGGFVQIKIQINEQGDVDEILEIDGPDIFRPAASEAVTRIKFSPTMCDGVAKSVTGVVSYKFRPFVFNESYFSPKSVEQFLDISERSKYFEPVLHLTENYRLAFGAGDKKFHPDAPLTKGEFAHFLRITLEMLSRRAKLADKDPRKMGVFFRFNPQRIRSVDRIGDLNRRAPYAESVSVLVSDYDIALVNESRQFVGRLPLTQNEVIDFWVAIFGSDAVPVNFQKVRDGDRLISRGEFALFLQESLYVLTYKVLP